jgi:rhodanese-related sulfurtransferase
MTESSERPVARRSPEQVDGRRAVDPRVRVLDVRSSDDRAASSTIPGSELLDVNAALADGNLDVLLEQGLSPDEPIVFVCNTGGKCGRAANFLASHGFDAVAVDGGMRAWQDAGLDVDPPESPNV